jgi:hypothetical protein
MSEEIDYKQMYEDKQKELEANEKLIRELQSEDIPLVGDVTVEELEKEELALNGYRQKKIERF